MIPEVVIRGGAELTATEIEVSRRVAAALRIADGEFIDDRATRTRDQWTAFQQAYESAQTFGSGAVYQVYQGFDGENFFTKFVRGMR